MVALRSSPRLADMHPPLRDIVAVELRRSILAGELAPGSRLVEDRLAERLGVSRNPVRDAIRVLAGEGFVEVAPRRGAFVTRLSAQEAENIFDVRMALEPLAARLASRRCGAGGLAALNELMVQAKDATEGAELDVLADLNTAFHTMVVELGGNHYLTGMAGPMIKRAQWLFRHTAETRAPHSWLEHQGLLDAIAGGDEEAAEREARNHVASARRSLEALSSTKVSPAH